MNIACRDRERIFLDGSAEEWAALEQHAVACAECTKEIRAWKSLSVAAEELRDYRENPALWSKIEISLQEQETRKAGFRARLAFWRNVPLVWQTALAGALVLSLALSGAYVVTHRPVENPASSKLLKNSALAEVERTERDYMKAIDKLAADAKPQLDSPATPLMASYREKLVVLDSAIDELRAQAQQNPSNAHLRYQLLAMYQEKQQTLHDVLEMKP
jgi:uracil-DNA glycosylase